jgi:hypothetical protein
LLERLRRRLECDGFESTVPLPSKTAHWTSDRISGKRAAFMTALTPFSIDDWDVEIAPPKTSQENS